MSLNVGSLWSSLSLDLTPFMQSLSRAQAAAVTAGNSMERAFGSGLNANMANTSRNIQAMGASVNGALGANLRNSARNVRDLGTAVNNAVGTNMLRPIQNTGGAVTRTIAGINNGLKDFRRIVAGILVSQTFYAILTNIQQSTKAVFDFNSSMEQAQASFTRLMGSAEQATTFINIMQDFAALTPFSVNQTLDMSRRMLAMGFEARSLKSVMTSITDATAAMGGDAQKFDRIVLALGQIKTNGKLAGQEVRQLAEAGIPIRTILREELNLTKEQVANIGKLGISGETAVGAILKGMDKRYKGMNAIIAETTGGMITTIKDDLLIIGGALSKGLFDSISGTTKKIRDALETMRKEIRERGLIGIITGLFPPKLYVAVQSFIGGLQMLGKAFKILYDAAKPIIAIIAEGILRALAVVVPVVAQVILVLARLTRAFIENVPGVKLFISALTGLLIANLVGRALYTLWTIIGLGSIAMRISKAVTALKVSIQGLYIALAKNPLIALVTVLAGSLLALALSSETVSKWLDQVWIRLAKLAGYNLSDTLKTGDLDKDKKELEAFLAEFEALGDGAEDADSKIKKFLASFDEVFAIPDDLDDLGSLFKDITPPKLDDIVIDDSDLKDDLDNLLDDKEDDFKKNFAVSLNFPNFPLMGVMVTTILETIETLIKKIKAATPISIPVVILGFAAASLAEIAEQISAIPKQIAINILMAAPSIVEVLNALELIPQLIYVSVQALTPSMSDVLAALKLIPTTIDIAVKVLTPVVDGVLSALKLIPLIIEVSVLLVWETQARLLESFRIYVLDPVTTAMNKVWVAITDIFDDVVTWLSQDWVKDLGIAIAIGIAAIAAAFLLAPVEVAAAIGAFTAGILVFFTTLWTDIQPSSAVGEDLADNMDNNVLKPSEKKVDSWGTSLKKKFSGIWQGILDIFNKALGNLSDTKVTVNQPTPKGFSPEVKNLLSFTPISMLADGGIVNKDSLIRAGEGNRAEAVIPLNGPSIARIADALLSKMNPPTGTSDATTNYFSIGTLIGDDRSITLLERRLNAVRIKEDYRRGLV
jgi:tape measure domain-containing protein